MNNYSLQIRHQVLTEEGVDMWPYMSRCHRTALDVYLCFLLCFEAGSHVYHCVCQVSYSLIFQEFWIYSPSSIETTGFEMYIAFHVSYRAEYRPLHLYNKGLCHPHSHLHRLNFSTLYFIYSLVKFISYYEFIDIDDQLINNVFIK